MGSIAVDQEPIQTLPPILAILLENAIELRGLPGIGGSTPGLHLVLGIKDQTNALRNLARSIKDLEAASPPDDGNAHEIQ